MADQSSTDLAATFNALPSGWTAAMGLRFVHVTREEVVGEIVVGPEHLQPYGLVHGGVYSGLIETLASVGAMAFAIEEGKSAVGLENHTSFLRAVQRGTLRGTAKPMATGRRTHVWEVAIRDDDGRVVATGLVRLMIVDHNADAGRDRAASQ